MPKVSATNGQCWSGARPGGLAADRWRAERGGTRDVMERSGMLKTLREQQRIFSRTHDAAECAVKYVSGEKGPCQVACGDLSQGVDPGASSGSARTQA